MGSYKWGCPLSRVIGIVTLLIALLITTHEPPSSLICEAVRPALEQKVLTRAVSA